MNAYAAAPTSAYKESAVLTAPPEQLVLMLYDGIHRFLFQARKVLFGAMPRRLCTAGESGRTWPGCCWSG